MTIDYGGGLIFPNSWGSGPPDPPEAPEYRLYVSPDRCTLVRFWEDGTVEVCTREFEGGIWGPPVELAEEEV